MTSTTSTATKDTRSNEICPNEIRSKDIRPNEIHPKEIRSKDTRPKDTRPKDIRPNRLDAFLTYTFVQSLPINYDRRCVTKFLMDVDKFQEVIETQQDELDTDVFPKVYDVLRSDPTVKVKTIDLITNLMVSTYGVYVETLAITRMTLGEQGTDRRDCANTLRRHKDELIHRYKLICKNRAISFQNHPQLKQVFLEYEQDSYALIKKECEDLNLMAIKAFKSSNVRMLNILFESVTFSVKLNGNDLMTSIML